MALLQRRTLLEFVISWSETHTHVAQSGGLRRNLIFHRHWMWKMRGVREPAYTCMNYICAPLYELLIYLLSFNIWPESTRPICCSAVISHVGISWFANTHLILKLLDVFLQYALISFYSICIFDFSANDESIINNNVSNWNVYNPGQQWFMRA